MLKLPLQPEHNEGGAVVKDRPGSWQDQVMQGLQLMASCDLCTESEGNPLDGFEQIWGIIWLLH